ncbi:hypothetical protein OKN36_00320 [Furfurilactobacillus sp. OKN36]
MSQFTYGGNTYSYSGTATIDDNGTFLVAETNTDGQPHVLTAADLAFFLQEHQHTVMRQNAKLRRYYKGDHDKIRNVRGKAAWKPNNKLPINFPKKLVDTFDGYFAGTPVKVDVAPTGDDQQDVVTADKFLATFNKLNDVPQTIFQLAKETSIVGRAYAYLYQGPDSQTHLASLRGEDGFVIYSMNIDRTPLYAVRLVRMNPQTQTYIVDVMTADGIVEQFDVASLQINDEETLGFEPVPISYGIVPMIEFNADDERMGLYEAATGSTLLFQRRLMMSATLAIPCLKLLTSTLRMMICII